MSHSSFMPRADYAVTQKVLHWLIVTHIVAALYLWLWLRDTITQRMLRFWRSEE